MSFFAYLAGSAGLLAGLCLVATSAFLLARRLLPDWSGPVLWVATMVLAAAIAIVAGLALGTFGLLHGWSYLALLALVTAASWHWRGDPPEPAPSDGKVEGPALVNVPAGRLLTWAALAIAAAAFGAFSVGVRIKYGTGMTGFDSTWYHGPFAAGFAQSGDTFSLQYLAPQFLSWFYPQNSELVHSFGVLAYGNDLLSPLINTFWFAGCLLAAWCIGRPYGGAPISMAGVALVLASAAMADQAGEARNDIVGTFFVLGALAVLINAAAGGWRITLGPAVVVAIAAGLAAGTKVNFIPAAFAIGVGVLALCEAPLRRRAAAVVAGGLLVGGGYWYLRNLIHSGNPLPWINHIGPLSLPGPDQDVGGRDAGSVWGYLTDTSVISDWFLPGLADGFGEGWLVLLALSVVAFVLCIGRDSGPARRTGAAVGIALVLAWLVAPTSASGPAGEPNGFVSGLRYLAPALAVSMALLGSAIGTRGGNKRWLVMAVIALLAPFTIWLGSTWSFRQVLGGLLVAGAAFVVMAGGRALYRHGLPGALPRIALVTATLVLVLLAGQVVQKSYFENRYENPDFTTAGLGAAFSWAQDIEDENIAGNATRQYPLFGRFLENEVQFVGIHEPHAGFVKPETCEEFRTAVADGDYRYLVVTLDRPSPKRDFAREVDWIEDDPAVREVLREEPTVVYELEGSPDPELCR